MKRLFKRRVYLDYAASTPTRKEVERAMKPFWSVNFANPLSLHEEGRKAKGAVNLARRDIASFIGALPEEIIFTSNGTESNNLAIRGFFEQKIKEGFQLEELHAICSEIEHSSVKRSFQELESRGLRVSYLKVGQSGHVDIAHLKELLHKDTVFLSVMLVNNEIGTIQPLREISKLLNHHKKTNGKEKIIFHTDALQAPVYLKIDVASFGVDLLSLDSGKMYGPKGVGLLYKKRGVGLSEVIYGGAQEKGLRPGTLNVPAIVGFAEAFRVVEAEKEKEKTRLEKMREHFLREAAEVLPGMLLNGSLENRIANNINIFLPGIESEFSVIKLDTLGFAVSSQSACLLETPNGSYVVSAIDKEGVLNGSSIRITLGKHTRYSDLSKLLKALESLYSLRIQL